MMIWGMMMREREREEEVFETFELPPPFVCEIFIFKKFRRQPTRRQLIEKCLTFWFYFFFNSFSVLFTKGTGVIIQSVTVLMGQCMQMIGPLVSRFRDSMKTNWIERDGENRRLIGSINFFWMTIFGALFSRKIVLIMQLLFKTFPKRKIQNKNETNRLTLCLSFKKYEPYSLGTGVQCHVYSPCVFSCKFCLEERKKSCETVTIVAHQTKHFQVQRTVIGEPAEGRKWFSPLRNRKTHGTNGRACRERHGYLNYIFQLMRFHFYFFKLQTKRRSLSVFPPSKKLEKCVHFARSSRGLDV
jgi:hypothetical protein